MFGLRNGGTIKIACELSRENTRTPNCTLLVSRAQLKLKAGGVFQKLANIALVCGEVDVSRQAETWIDLSSRSRTILSCHFDGAAACDFALVAMHVAGCHVAFTHSDLGG